MIRVAVFGANGKMGRVVCEAVDADPETELVAAVNAVAGATVAGGVKITSNRQAVLDARAEVAVDFTVASSARENVAFCLENGVHAVVGTTGLGEADLDRFRGLSEAGRANIFLAPNFSIGAVLMMHLSHIAARYLGSCEVIELHHNQKVDAPSGTALKTAREIAHIWAEHGRPPGGEPAPGEHEVVQGSRGGDVGGVRVHSVRGQGLIAHQEVIFGGPGQTLTIRHDAPERTSYMPGVLLAVKQVASRRGLTVGLEHLLDL